MLRPARRRTRWRPSSPPPLVKRTVARRWRLAHHPHADRNRLVAPHAVGTSIDSIQASFCARTLAGKAYTRTCLGLQARQHVPQVALRLIAVGQQHQTLDLIGIEAEQRLVQRRLDIGGALLKRTGWPQPRPSVTASLGSCIEIVDQHGRSANTT